MILSAGHSVIIVCYKRSFRPYSSHLVWSTTAHGTEEEATYENLTSSFENFSDKLLVNPIHDVHNKLRSSEFGWTPYVRCRLNEKLFKSSRLSSRATCKYPRSMYSLRPLRLFSQR